MVVRVAIAVGFITASWGMYEYGRYKGGFDLLEAQSQQDAMADKIELLNSDNEEMRRVNAVLEKAREVDRLAYDDVDRSLEELQREVVELGEEVAFYRGIVHAGENPRGLQIQSFQLRRNGESNLYSYRLILTQYMKNNRVLSGAAEMMVNGVQDLVRKELTLDQLAADSKTRLNFRFKYFQELAGEIELPEGFTPIKVTLRALPEAKGGKPVERSFNWSELIL